MLTSLSGAHSSTLQSESSDVALIVRRLRLALWYFLKKEVLVWAGNVHVNVFAAIIA